jgi:integrase
MEGSLITRGKGKTWYLVFDLPKQGNKRNQQTVRVGRMPKSHAEARKREILQLVDKGQWVEERASLSVEKFLAEWLDVTRERIAARTHERYASLVETHINPVIGHLALGKVAQQHVRQIHKRMSDKGLSKQTALHVHRALHTAFAFAVREERILRENVVGLVPAPNPGERTLIPMRRDRIRLLLETAKGTRLEPVVALAALTGLRRGELLALRWQNIDFEIGALQVTEALEHTRTHGVRFKAPKSRASKRRLPLPPMVLDLLRLHRAAQEEGWKQPGAVYVDNGLVLPNPDGTPWPPDSLSVQFGKLARLAGCQGFRFHDLRHSFATLMLADGTNLREVSELLGHSSSKLTLATYAHTMEGMGRSAVNSLARSLLSPSAGAEALVSKS